MVIPILAATAVAGSIWVSIYTMVCRCRAQLNGSFEIAGAGAEVVIRRDANGVPDIEAADRRDAAFGTGFVHAQERYFQMDVSRRIGAGELAELFGRKTLPIDRMLRLHQFRKIARRAVDMLDEPSRELLRAYTGGVNAGLKSLRGMPFEYFLTGAPPAGWQEEDSLLVVYSLYVLLQDGRGDQKFHLQQLYDNLPAELSEFLAPTGDENWDAPLLGDPIMPPPAPGPGVFPVRSIEPAQSDPNCEPEVMGLINGSNCWVVSGEHTSHGAAMLANDMHLGFGMPNSFFRASIRYRDAGVAARHLCGFTIPGYPLLVTGSNARISWGLTNSAADWVDLVTLQENQHVVDQEIETIQVKGWKSQELVIRKTPWGPIIRDDGRGAWFAQRWVAHYPEAVNLDLRHVEESNSTEEALAVAPRCGIPAQNFHVADAAGCIGWTIAGRIPRRERYSRLPMTPATAGEWHGWLPAGEYPVVFNPASGRIWTANARTTDQVGLEKLGHGFYILGARAKQIRDGLHRPEKMSESDFLALQLDDRAVFLERWRNILLELLEQVCEIDSGRLELRTCVREWRGRASAGCAGYRAVRAFRYAVKSIVLEPFITHVRKQCPNFDLEETGDQWEAPLWRIVSERPDHLLPSRFSNWDEALLFAADATIRHLTRSKKSIHSRTWGEYNRLKMRHPFSLAIPLLGRWLDMPSSPLSGDLHMPLSQIAVHGPVQRMVVSPGREDCGIAHLGGGQTLNPLSPYFGKGHDDWLRVGPPVFFRENLDMNCASGQNR